MKTAYLMSPEYLPGSNMSSALRDQRDIVIACRELGMAGVFAAEHLSREDSVWLPPLLALTRVAEHSGEMMLGTSVLIGAFHHPIELAEQVAFLDAMTGGRFILGLAAGWNRSEFESMGVPLSTRGAALDETITVLRLLWGSKGPVSFKGSVYQFENVEMSFRPTHGAEQPIWLGGSSTRALRRAAAVGDNWIVSSHMAPTDASIQARIYLDELDKVGRERPAIRPGIRSIFVGKSEEAAARVGGETLTGSYQVFGKWGLFRDVLNNDVDNVRYLDVTGRALIGDIDSVAAGLIEFGRMTGVNLLIVRGQWLGLAATDIIRSLEVLHSDVMPIVNHELACQNGSRDADH